MTKLSRIAKVFAAAGIAFSGVVTPDAVALAKAIESGNLASIHAFIANNSQSEYVGDAIIYLVDKGGHDPQGPFKDPGDSGRPDSFGPPGPPVIGPPGQYKA